MKITDLTLKQKFGFRKYFRSRQHNSAAVDACLHTLETLKVRHLCITGDLVHLGTPSEIQAASDWFAALRQRGFICHFVPGNHDAMTSDAKQCALTAWSQEMGGSPELTPTFPYLNKTKHISFIGLDTSLITPFGLACGYLDCHQCRALEHLLDTAEQLKHFRVVLLHHPPIPGVESLRRRLYGMRRFHQSINLHGAELILHGHVRKPLRATIQTPRGPVPVFGAAPLSESRGGDTTTRFTLFTLHHAPQQATLAHQAFGWDTHSDIMKPISPPSQHITP